MSNNLCFWNNTWVRLYLHAPFLFYFWRIFLVFWFQLHDKSSHPKLFVLLELPSDQHFRIYNLVENKNLCSGYHGLFSSLIALYYQLLQIYPQRTVSQRLCPWNPAFFIARFAYLNLFLKWMEISSMSIKNPVSENQFFFYEDNDHSRLNIMPKKYFSTGLFLEMVNCADKNGWKVSVHFVHPFQC